MEIAVLITCHNRRQKTEKLLSSLFAAIAHISCANFDVFLIDDGSTDGTSEMITEKYPQVRIIKGNGHLYWSSGMRMAWNTALSSGNTYNGFLLLNDDVELLPDFWKQIETTMNYADKTYNRQGLYALSTKDKITEKFTYGGHFLDKRLFKHSFYHVEPKDEPQECQLTGGNILYVPCDVVENIGIFDSHFKHSFADLDYSLTAWEKKIPVLVCPNYGGYCTNDHFAISTQGFSLRKRIDYLYAPKGRELNEWIYYLCKHSFRLKAVYYFVVLWLKTLFPKLQ